MEGRGTILIIIFGLCLGMLALPLGGYIWGVNKNLSHLGVCEPQIIEKHATSTIFKEITATTTEYQKEYVTIYKDADCPVVECPPCVGRDEEIASLEESLDQLNHDLAEAINSYNICIEQNK